jgi:DNA-directed RNA polymerase subunit RPC12/RpoP
MSRPDSISVPETQFPKMQAPPPLATPQWPQWPVAARAPYDVASEIAAMAELMRSAAAELSALEQRGASDEPSYGMYQCSQCSMTWAGVHPVRRDDDHQLPRCPRIRPYRCHSRFTVLVYTGPSAARQAFLEYNFARRRISRLAPRSIVQSPPPPPASDASPLLREDGQRTCPSCSYVGTYNNPRAHRCRRCRMRVFVTASAPACNVQH